MDGVYASKAVYPIFFGNLQLAYRIVDRVGISTLRDPYTSAASGKVNFYTYKRVGGLVVLPEAVKVLKQS